jgi:hypothetical protein
VRSGEPPHALRPLSSRSDGGVTAAPPSPVTIIGHVTVAVPKYLAYQRGSRHWCRLLTAARHVRRRWNADAVALRRLVGDVRVAPHAIDVADAEGPERRVTPTRDALGRLVRKVRCVRELRAPSTGGRGEDRQASARRPLSATSALAGRRMINCRRARRERSRWRLVRAVLVPDAAVNTACHRRGGHGEGQRAAVRRCARPRRPLAWNARHRVLKGRLGRGEGRRAQRAGLRQRLAPLVR